jgi:hypothetical protein
MKHDVLYAASLVAVGTLLLAGCSASKSADPLSPSVAGPIPGVNISAPRIMQPLAGSKVAVDQQPLTLTVANATTNGVRPLTYLFEIAADTNFTNIVLSRDSIAPGDNGQTSLRLSDALATGHTYYWRARAQDGANTGSYTTPADFNVYTPVVLQAPGPISPINNATTDSLRPTFTFSNAARTGPAGAITYTVEVGDSGSFTNAVSANVAEQSGQTALAASQDLPAARQLFWHVRAFDPTTVGPWSATQVFQTPAAPSAPSPTPPGGGGLVGPAPNDAINLNQVAVYNSPSDIASWPVTSKITSLDMSPSSGLTFHFTTENSWPNPIPPGFTGGIQYTVWAVVKINGQWNTSGFIEMWQGRGNTGAPILSDFARNWAYDGRWGPMMGHQPVAGEQMGFFLSAGDARGRGEPTSYRERTNVILVNLPAGDSGSFGF